VTQLLGDAPLLGWVVIAFGAIQSIRLWRNGKKYRTKAVPKPGGRAASAVEGLMLAVVWLIGGALVLYPVAPGASVVMVAGAVLCFPATFVCVGLLAALRVDDLAAWMGWPRPEGRWRRGVLQSVGVAHSVAGVAMFVLVIYAARSLLGG
jgi:hypothetical protein